MAARTSIIAYRIKDARFDDAVAFYRNLLQLVPEFYPAGASLPQYAVFTVFDVDAADSRYSCQLRLKRVANVDTKDQKSPVVYWGTDDVRGDYDNKLRQNHQPNSDDEPLGEDPVDDGKEAQAQEEMGSVVDNFGNRTGVTINPPWPRLHGNSGPGSGTPRGTINPPWPAGKTNG